MKRNIIRVFALFLCIILLPIFTPFVLAENNEIVASGECGDNLIWTLDREGTLTISGTGNMKNYYQRSPAPWSEFVVKKAVIQEGVSSVGDSAFWQSTQLASVSLPGSLKCIGVNAFEECTALEHISLPSGLETIYGGAFIKSGIRELVVPGSVKIIPNYLSTFCGSLTDAVFEEGCEQTSSFLFAYCVSLRTVSIPSTLTKGLDDPYIFCDGFYLFEGTIDRSNGCPSLQRIAVDKANPRFASDDAGALYDKQYGVFLKYPTGSELREYSIPDGIKTIGYASFLNSAGLTDIRIPASVNTIYLSAFHGCDGLKNIRFEGTREQWNSITFMIDYYFEDEEVIYPEFKKVGYGEWEGEYFNNATVYCADDEQTTEEPSVPNLFARVLQRIADFFKKIAEFFKNMFGTK